MMTQRKTESGSESGPIKGIFSSIRRFHKETGGAIAIVTALSLPVVVGFVGLGVEVGLWFHAKRGLQSAADAAALSGAYERLAGNNNAVATQAAGQATTANGYDGTLGDAIVVNIPPLAGDFTGNADAVEVIMSRDLSLLFSSVFTEGDVTINAYAVATLTAGTDGFCILALDESASGAITVGGNPDVELNCGIATNSNAVDSVNVFGSATVEAKNVQAVGGVALGGSGSLTTTDGIKQNAGRIVDPYASTPEPIPGACDHNSQVKIKNGDNTTLQPGTYCGSIKITGGNATFAPGVYILDGGDLVVNGGVTYGEDVFFYLTDDAEVDINGNAAVELAADPDGDSVGDDYTGMLFYQDPDSTGTSSKFNGGGDMTLTGVVYFPSQPLEFTGGNDTGGCTVLVGSTVEFKGNSGMQIECEDRGIDLPVAPGNVALAG